MSVQVVHVSRQPLGFHVDKQFTALGWYERLRLARYFHTAATGRVAVPGDTNLCSFGATKVVTLQETLDFGIPHFQRVPFPVKKE